MSGFLRALALGFLGMAVLVVVVAGPTGLRPATGSAMWKWTHALPTGVNAPGITHFGYGDFLPATTASDVDTSLRELNRMGVTVVRLFPAYDHITAEEAADRLDRFLTKAEAYDISAIVSFINYYDSGHNPAGTSGFYTEHWQGIPYLNHEFMARGYQGAYEDFVRTVVSINRGHTNIYAWEPGNELQDRDPATFIHFMQNVSGLIKSLDPGRPVASGMIEARQAALTPEEMYSQLPDVDIVAIHPGNGYRGSAGDVDWALAHGRKAIVEETGFAGTNDRTARYQHELDYWRTKGVSAFIVDGFIAKGLPDNGQGDTSLGFDTIWHTDYDGIAGLLRAASHPWPLPFSS